MILVLHDYLFGGRFSNVNPDVQSVFLLNHCFLGTALKNGAIPAWNPFTMAGTPFVADPQSGWMYLAPMLLYGLFPCSVAVRLFLVLPPLVAGLGLYWFLRGEALSRAAATSAGIVMALAIAGSKVLVNLPFSDALAWIPLLLACGARCIRASTWSARFGWIALTSIAWGQLAAAHLSHGLVMGTTIFIAYLIFVARRAGIDRRTLTTLAACLVVTFPLVNLAHLLPIAGYMGRASLGLGYDELWRLSAELRREPIPPLEIFRALGPQWPLRFATAPGLYLGAIPLLAAPAAFVVARTRTLAIIFSSLAVAFYILGLRGVTEVLSPLVEGLPYGDFYRHSAGRFFYGVLFCAVVVAALGIDAWRDAWRSRTRATVVIAGAVAWIAVPLAAGAFPSRMILFVVGALGGGILLAVVVTRPKLLWLIPVLLSIELGTGVLIGQANGDELEHDGLETEIDAWLPMHPLPEPGIDAATYVRGGRLAHAITTRDSDDRLIVAGTGLTWLFRPAVARIEIAHGYNPIELPRYWYFMRRVVDAPIRYNLSIFADELPAPNVLDLLQTGWVAARPGMVVPAGAERVAVDRRHRLYRLPDVSPRAELVENWEVTTAEDALADVAAYSFDPSEIVLLEKQPRFLKQDTEIFGSAPRVVSYDRRGTDRVVVETVSAQRAILLVRNAWDVNWHATIDGEPTDVLVADYFLQGVAVPPGERTVELKYDDPYIVPGLIGSALAFAVLAAAALIARRVERS
ncbi:MAG: hypothetical protein ACRDKT_15635 [Actinomycetota bacterium]